MKDLAEEAGCSVNTVSRALRQDPGISEARRKQINDLAAKRGYIPDPLVSAFCSRLSTPRGNRTYQAGVAVLNPMLDRFSDSALLKKIEIRAVGALQDRGFSCERFSYAKWKENGRRLLQILHTRGIQGLIFFHFNELNTILDWDLSRFSMVSYGYTLQAPDLHRVSENHAQAIDLALEQVTQKGYRRPGLVLSRHQHHMSRGIRSGRFLSWYAERGTDPAPLFIDWHPTHEGRQALQDWYTRHQPDVLLCNGKDPLQALLHGMRLTVPEDLAHVDLSLEQQDPGQAGIHIDPDRCGIALAELLIAQLNRNERGIPPHPRISLIRSQWQDGSSCPGRPL